MGVRAAQRDANAGQERFLLAILAVAAVLAGVALLFAWALPIAVAWVHSGQLAHLTIAKAISAVGTGHILSGDPARAYPPSVRRLLPGGAGYWTTTLLLLVLPAAAAIAAGRQAWAGRDGLARPPWAAQARVGGPGLQRSWSRRTIAFPRAAGAVITHSEMLGSCGHWLTTQWLRTSTSLRLARRASSAIAASMIAKLLTPEPR